MGLVTAEDGINLYELIHAYANELSRNHQQHAAERVLALHNGWEQRFIKVVPAEADAGEVAQLT